MIRKLSANEYQNAATKAGIVLPIEQAPPWLDFDAALTERRPLCLFVYQAEKATQPTALFSMTQYLQPRYKMIWIKHGPVWVQPPNKTDITAFTNELKQHVVQHAPDITFVRLNLPASGDGYAPASMHHVMYDQTVVIDLTKSDDDRLADMTQSGRRALRKAWQAKLHTKELKNVTETNFAPLYEILQETANRDKFGIHPQKLYLAMLEALGLNARLYVIYHDKQPLAWAIITTYNQQAVYYYGASSSQAREFNAPYQLHWDITQMLKAEGAKTYDFMGIASSGNEHLKNVSVFKEKFSRSTVVVPSSYDVIIRPGRYKLLGLLRKTRQKIRFM
jgi:hypothetical protein